MTIDDVMDIIHGHPTYSEALYEAMADCIDMCIHAPKKKTKQYKFKYKRKATNTMLVAFCKVKVIIIYQNVHFQLGY